MKLWPGRFVLVLLMAASATTGSGSEPGRFQKQDWLLSAAASRSEAVPSPDGREWSLANGLIRRVFRIDPNGATVALDDLRTGQHLLRAVKPELELTLNGKVYPVGGLAGQPNLAYLTPEWLNHMTNLPNAFRLQRVERGIPAAPLSWKRSRPSADLPWPPAGAALQFIYRGTDEPTRDLEVALHYEIYDGIPVVGKHFTLRNLSDRPVVLDHFINEKLAFVEGESAVDTRERHQWLTPAVDILSDYMFKGMDPATAGKVAAWDRDPAYTTQVSYELQTPCLLVCQPPVGPGKEVKPGGSFTGIRTYLVLHDTTDRERRSLALRRSWRVLAPWTTENPIMMHVRNARSDLFRTAVDQCAEVGFEMIIYTFGSGLNLESTNAAYIARIKSDVDYAHARGVQVGAYSLFSSRRIDDENDVINPATGKPGGAIFGSAPCFASRWGLNYFRVLTNFLAQTGLDLLEHDGPYPGDICASTRHPGHRGESDSQWEQWRLSADLYSWCRSRGIYVNQPDCYFLVGGNKTAMGYRENNWSLPRAQQLIHARQNIHDGTWTKTSSMGWMFVPLTEYQGGGSAATLEPLQDHLREYELHLLNTLGAGVQACWRGPRLFDSDATRDLVRKWVGWFKQHRAILESDLIHTQRATGQDLDSYLHVNPHLPQKGMLIVFNPLDHAVRKTLLVPLYYSGLTRSAKVRQEEGRSRRLPLDAQARLELPVEIPAQGFSWFVIE